MLIKVADLLKEAQVVDDTKVDLSDLEREFGLTEEDIMQPPYEGGRLRREFEKKNTNKLVLIDKTGQLWSVLQENNTTFISPLKVSYSVEQYTPFQSIEEAEDALPEGWEVHTDLTGHV